MSQTIHQGEALKNALKESGLSSNDFAIRYGLHRNSINDSIFAKPKLSTQMLNTLRNNGFNMDMLILPYDALNSRYMELQTKYDMLLTAIQQLTEFNELLKKELNNKNK